MVPSDGAECGALEGSALRERAHGEESEPNELVEEDDEDEDDMDSADLARALPQDALFMSGRGADDLGNGNLAAVSGSGLLEGEPRSRPGLALSRPPISSATSAFDVGEEDDDDSTLASRRHVINADTPSPSRSSARGTQENASPSRRSSGNASDAGDRNHGSRARDLISRELLDELSHEHDEWGEGRPSTPLAAGFETPSDTRTPSPRDAPQRTYSYGNPAEVPSDGLMCMDHWDWKTDAPEFVPGSMKGIAPAHSFVDSSVVAGAFAPGAWPMGAPQPPPPPGRIGPVDGQGADSVDGVRLSQIRQHYEWQLRSKSDELHGIQNRMQQVEIETAQVRASWELERRNLVRQIGHYRAVLDRYCIPIEEAGSGAGMTGPDGPGYYPAFEPSAPSSWYGSTASAQTQAPGDGTGLQDDSSTSSLDSKMRQLNNLLQEGQVASHRRLGQSDSFTEEDPGTGPRDGASKGGANGDDGYSSGNIATTLRAMFPHATIRTRSDDEPDTSEEVPSRSWPSQGRGETPRDPDNENVAGYEPAFSSSQPEAGRSMDWHIQQIERATGGTVDDRAYRVLQALPIKEAKEALLKVDELMQSQGGNCRNLSSILQSVCRKMERRMGGRSASKEESRYGASRGVGGANSLPISGEGGRSRRARRLDEDGDAFQESSGSEGNGVGRGPPSTRALQHQMQLQNPSDTPMSRRSNKSWADIQSGDEEEMREASRSMARASFDAPSPSPEDVDCWTQAHLEKTAQRGFEMRRRGDHWDLKITMSGLQPPLTESTMERYCAWLQQELSDICKEHGEEALWHCRGEVDFSQNRMSNQMVWTLLETLAQHEVHTALLKLFANNISQGGVLAICEFIRRNERAEAVQELHLSHNEIDDESALELLRTLQQQRPRYPPKRFHEEGSGDDSRVPVWLRLNHNRIRDPEYVRRTAEAEGISICTAWDRNACGTSKCCRRDSPLVHLYNLSLQDAQRERFGEGESERMRRRARQRNRLPEARTGGAMTLAYVPKERDDDFEGRGSSASFGRLRSKDGQRTFGDAPSSVPPEPPRSSESPSPHPPSSSPGASTSIEEHQAAMQ